MVFLNIVKSLPKFKFFDIHGNEINNNYCKEKFNIFIFFNPSILTHKMLIKYAQIIFDRYQKNNLNIIGISFSEINEALIIKNICSIKFPLIADSNGYIHRLFKKQDCCGGFLFTYPDGNLIFDSNILPNEESFRQLVEKNIVGSIDYNFENYVCNYSFKKGDIFPDQLIINTLNGEIIKLSEITNSLLIMTFFTSFCSSCRQYDRINTLLKIKKKWKDFIILGFLEPFELKDVREIPNITRIPFKKFIFKNFLSNDQIYVTDDKLKPNPWTIIIDETRRIIFVERPMMTEMELLKAISITLDYLT